MHRNKGRSIINSSMPCCCVCESRGELLVIPLPDRWTGGGLGEKPPNSYVIKRATARLLPYWNSGKAKVLSWTTPRAVSIIT